MRLYNICQSKKKIDTVGEIKEQQVMHTLIKISVHDMQLFISSIFVSTYYLF